MSRGRISKLTGRPALADTGDLMSARSIIFPGTGYGDGDAGSMVVVIPFYLRGKASWRERGLRTVLESFLRSGVHVWLVTQGDCLDRNLLPMSDRLHLEIVSLASKDFHKSTLINRGIEAALKTRSDWTWLFQCDADLCCAADSLLAFLQDLPADANYCQPWSYWKRLTRVETQAVIDSPSTPRSYGAVSPREINFGFGAGGLVIARRVLEAGFRWDERFRNWGWEDSDTARRLMHNWGQDLHTHPQAAVHLWHENDRVLELANGQQYFDGEIPTESLTGVLLESKTKYLLVAHGRSGGNLFSRALTRHPQVHCGVNEDFINTAQDPPIMGDNLSLRKWTLLGPMASEKPVVGLRMQYHVAAAGYEFDAEHYIRWAYSQGFQLLHLMRRDHAAAAMSWLMAWRTGHWITKPYPETAFEVDLDVFRQHYRAVVGTSAKWGPLLADLGAELFYYEDLCRHWEPELNRAFHVLGVQSAQVPQPIPKQATKHYSLYATNWPDVEAVMQDEDHRLDPL